MVRNEILERLSDEHIVNAYLNGQLSGIVDTENYAFVPVRITGLGLVDRFDEEATRDRLLNALYQLKNLELTGDESFETLKELASNSGLQVSNYAVHNKYDRKAEEFASNLDIYNGLPLTIDHPRDENGNATMLTPQNIDKNPIVGTIIKAYLKEGAVWGVAKIYDKSVFSTLQSLSSTSPAFETYGMITDSSVRDEQPLRLNHLAFVDRGFWDSRCGSRAIDFSKLTKGDGMAEFIDNDNEAKKIDSITDETATPEVSAAKVDSEPEEEAAKVDSEPEEEAVIDSEVEGEQEVDEDKEREAVIDHFRSAIDEMPKGKLSMPYISGRKHPGAVLSAILNQNYHFVDSKYRGIVLESQARPKANYHLLVDAYNKMLSDVEASVAAEKKERGLKAKGFQPTERANVRIDRNF